VTTEELGELIGKSATIALAEAFGGTRLYVPRRVAAEHVIARTIGLKPAEALCRTFGQLTIRVPLARELRARRLREQGMSNAKIAVSLGLTEGGVRGLFKRLERQPDGPASPSNPEENSGHVDC